MDIYLTGVTERKLRTFGNRFERIYGPIYDEEKKCRGKYITMNYRKKWE